MVICCLYLFIMYLLFILCLILLLFYMFNIYYWHIVCLQTASHRCLSHFTLKTSLWSTVLIHQLSTVHTVTHSAFSVFHCDSSSISNPNQCFTEALSFFFSFSYNLSTPLPFSLFVLFISHLRRIASHVSLVTIVMLWGSQHLQENAGKVSSVWREQIVLTPLWETVREDRAQKVIRSFTMRTFVSNF